MVPGLKPIWWWMLPDECHVANIGSVRSVLGQFQVFPMAGFVNRHRRLVDAQGPIVGGFVLAGDSAMQISPTLGRGVSLAVASAQRLAQKLDSHATDAVTFVEEFDGWINEHLAVWFKSQ